MAESMIFQMQENKLIEMREQPYDTESLLQDFLSSHPALLAGEQMNQTEPRRWLLVQPEMSVPDRLSGTGRWALDHLFLDQDARPTFVEVKRSTDTRIRREVIGQMLDYAANATAYWPGDRLRNEFEKRCVQNGDDPAQQVMEFCGGDVDDFWARAAENLQEGRLRLLFVADVLPPELRRVIEFLNGAFTDIEVLGVEVKQYKGENALALVPRVIGQTVKAQDKKTPQPSKRGETWTLERCSEDLKARGLMKGEGALRSMVAFAERHKLIIEWGKGSAHGSLMLRPADTKGNYLYFYSDGELSLNSTAIQQRHPFDDRIQYEQLEHLFGQLTSVGSLATAKISVRNLRDDYKSALDIFLKTIFNVEE